MQDSDLNATSKERPKFPDALENSVHSALKEVLGESGSKATVYFLGPIDYNDVEGFHLRLKKLFGSGVLSLEAVILRHLAAELDLPATILKPEDFVKSVSAVRAHSKQGRKS